MDFTQYMNSAQTIANTNNQAYQDYYNRSNAYNSAEALANRQWQEYMSNTSYQRAVADLKAAGLNPVLAAMNGGASTPSGSSASSATGQVDTSMANLLTSIIGATAQQNVAEINAMSATNVANINSETSKYNTQKGLDMDLYLARNYPSNWVGMLASAFGGVDNLKTVLQQAFGWTKETASAFVSNSSTDNSSSAKDVSYADNSFSYMTKQSMKYAQNHSSASVRNNAKWTVQGRGVSTQKEINSKASKKGWIFDESEGQ